MPLPVTEEEAALAEKLRMQGAGVAASSKKVDDKKDEITVKILMLGDSGTHIRTHHHRDTLQCTAHLAHLVRTLVGAAARCCRCRQNKLDQ